LLLTSDVWAAAGDGGRVLNNVMLLGGADLRHLFAPQPSTDYGAVYWANRETVHTYNKADPDSPYPYDPQAVWDNEYLHVTAGDLTFGINKKADWLHQQFLAGNVAVICNVNGSENQRHDHSQLIVNSGYKDIRNYNYDTSGWGGRLAEYIGLANANVVSFANNISVFANGTNSSARNTNIISAPNTRDIALIERPLSEGDDSEVAVLSRSLKAYYAKRGIELTGPQLKIIQHERQLRQFGGAVKTILDAVSSPITLTDLQYGGVSQLHHHYFGTQLASLYDAHQVNVADPSILNFRVASLEYHHWDTHKYQKTGFEANIYDLFGIDRGLDRFYNVLDPADLDNQVFVFTSDFGRQIRSNGSGGTDHGKASYTIIIGNAVRGGVYGEMFPQSEITPVGGLMPYDRAGMWIEGRTSFEHVLGEVCDWVAGAGAGNFVFPGRATNTEIEKDKYGNNVPIHTLFASAVYSISGTVIDESGLPVQNASVAVIDTISGTVFSAVTDESGFYSIGDLIAGIYEVKPTLKRYNFTASTVELNLGDVTRDFVAVLKPGTISGRVINEVGEGVEGISIWDVYSYPSSTVTTDKHGRYLLSGFDNGDQVYVLINSGPNYTVSPGSYGLVHTGGSETGYDFVATLKTGTVSGKITLEDGTPVTGAVIWDANRYPESTIYTDEMGNYVMSGYSAGDSVVLVTSGNTAYGVAPSIDHFVHDGGVVTGHNFVATISQGTVSGHILTPEGEPVEGIKLWDILRWPDTTTTDSRGFYMITGKKAGDYVWLNGNFYGPRIVKPVSGSFMFIHDGTAMDFNMTAEHADSVPTLSGTVSAQTGEPIAGIRLQIWNKTTGVYVKQVVTDSNGAYSTRLPNGTYLVLPDSSYDSIFKALGGTNTIIIDSADVSWNFVATSVVYEVSGTLKTANGRPATNVKVGIYSNTGFVKEIYTDDRGQYSVAVRNGMYIVWPWNDDNYASFKSSAPSIFINVSNTPVVVDWTALPKNYLVSGTATTESGFPIRNHGLTISDNYGGQVSVTTDTNGAYSTDIPSGTNYVITATAGERYSFSTGFSMFGGPVVVPNIIGSAVLDNDGDEIANQDDNCINTANFDQRDTNTDGFGNICDPDLDNDLDVDMEDKRLLNKLIGTMDPDADFDGDGIVTLEIDQAILMQFQKAGLPPGPSGLVP